MKRVYKVNGFRYEIPDSFHTPEVVVGSGLKDTKSYEKEERAVERAEVREVVAEKKKVEKKRAKILDEMAAIEARWREEADAVVKKVKASKKKEVVLEFSDDDDEDDDE